ncbi:MAG: protein kinase [Kofleriaceae bacterium]|jgi:serine/threonine protein kinase|nr:protein kinase [Kofleriaceae bacterium]MBP9168371.1 protein kinase [Kofleriaceae bacterium]MBP9857250.1 protein kinase [Kofleriaceae bacterium]
MTLPLDPQEPSGQLTQEQFGPYTVFERLGVGGMATVHRAKQRGIEGIERVVALKRLLPHLAEDATFIKSFVREAKLALMLHHANVVQLFELGKVGGVYFIAMEYIDGRDVRRILRQARKVSGPPTINVTLSLLIQACEALEYAHTKCDDDGEPLGLVHRDVSPSNLMVTRSGHLKVIDFGIAKAQSQQLRTQTGRVKGKLAYMAPEAIAGKELDARSDLFSIGVIAHELLTARPLFASKNEYQTLLNVQKSELIPPSAFNQAVPPELDAIVLRALARDPDERYGSAAELRDDLHAVRIRYQLSATNREVQAWSDWAFSLEAPGGNFSGPAVTDSLAGASRSPIAARTPLPLPLRARPAASDAPPARASSRAQSHDEEEAADVAWGGGLEQDSNREPVDDVPDYSRPGLAAAAASVDDSRDPTLIGVMAPAAQSRRPTTFPHGSSSDAVPSRGSVTAIPVATDLADPTAPNPRASSPAFGAAIVEKRGGGAGKVALIGLALAALGGGGYLAFGRGGGGAAKPTATESVAPATGSLKFIVEPADAQVKIAGLDAHSGSPWQIDLEPGVIQVKVSRDGYVSWETSVELSAKETQTIRVVLAQAPAGPEANMAILVLDSEPQGLAVILDGQELPERTPIKLPVNPGAHTVSLRQNGEVVWRQKFDAEPRTQYEFAPSMSEVKRREREAREAALPVRDRVATTPSRPTPPVTPPTGPGPGTAVATVTPPPPVTPPSVTPPPVTPVTPPAITAPPVAPPPGPGTGSAKPVMPPPPPVAKGPVVVPPTAVKRVSGELPRLTTIARPGTEVPPTVSVKICIDAGGAVTSATAYKLTGDVANGLTSAIKKWRYSPYVADGRAVGACFVNVFSLK